MKISKRQVEILSEKIRDRIISEGRHKLSDLKLEKINAFFEKRKALDDVVKQAQSELNQYDATFSKISNGRRGIYVSHGKGEVIKALQQGEIPTLRQIEDKIILKGMFDKESSLEELIESISNSFKSKKQEIV